MPSRKAKAETWLSRRASVVSQDRPHIAAVALRQVEDIKGGLLFHASEAKKASLAQSLPTQEYAFLSRSITLFNNPLFLMSSKAPSYSPLLASRLEIRVDD